MRQKPFKLRFLLAASITMLALVITTVVSYTIGRSGLDRLERSIGLSLAMLADQMQDKLDRGLFERIREINNMAAIVASGAESREPQPVRQWLELMQSTLPDYVWIGVADAGGQVSEATRGMLVGSSVSHESWFRAGLKGAVFGDVHGDGTLREHLPLRTGEANRLIAVAAPINVKGQIKGVVGAQLNWNWAKEVQDSLFGSVGGNEAIEALVIGHEGTVLLGPPGMIGKLLNLESVKTQSLGTRRFAVETWPDGLGYLSGFAEDVEYPLFGGLGWRILVRQKAEVALVPVVGLRQQILIWSTVFVGLSALLSWFLAGRLAAPLLRLSTVADRLRRGEAIAIPHVGVYAEAEILSNSLRTLVDELRNREARLSHLNVSLERQVADRTRKLERRNVQLADAKEKAEAATASKSRFLAAASHDLRQPLHALTLFARALSRRVEGREAKGLVAQTEQALASLKEMFDALLNVSRLDAGLIQPNAQDVAMSEFIDRVSAGFRAEAEQRGLTFRSRSVDSVVRIDQALLETLVRNLLSNALKFTKRGGVMLVCRRVGDRLSIEVIDSGLGIAPDAGDAVFQEFERSKFAAAGANDGLGLGLSIVKRYAELLGIDVSYRSRPGHGTRFRVLLPAGAEIAVGDVAVAPAAEACSLKQRRILVLDDEPLIVESLSRDLTDRGNSVLRAGTTAEAETLIRAGAPDALPEVVVVDFNLASGETGLAFIERLEKELGIRLPTLVLTGATDAVTLSALMQSGRRWLTKPADPDAIAKVLAGLAAEPAETSGSASATTALAAAE